MKKSVMFALTILLIVGCYDDSALWEKVKNQENRLAEMETLCKRLNTNITSLQSLSDVLSGNDYILRVVPFSQNGKEVGYVINFAKGDPVTIYHGTDGKDGSDGKDGTDGKDGKDGEDGAIPAVGMKLHTDGIYYWTIDGNWLMDDSGNMIPASGEPGADGEDGNKGEDGKDGITPKLKIKDNYWYVSYNNGESWEQLYKAVGDKGESGEDGYSMFKDVKVEGDYLYIILLDGTELKMFFEAGTDEPYQTIPATLTLGNVTATTAAFNGEITVKKSELKSSKVILYYTDSEVFDINTAKSVSLSTFNSDNTFAFALNSLKYNTEYQYLLGAEVNSISYLGEVSQFTTADVTVDISVDDASVTASSATVSGKVSGLSASDNSIEIGVFYSTKSGEVESGKGLKLAATGISSSGEFTLNLSDLYVESKYYYSSYIMQGGVYSYGAAKEFTTKSVTMTAPSDATDLSGQESANCYIISAAGKYCFKAVKGNTSGFIGKVPSSVSVLCEGTDADSSSGVLVSSVSYKDGYITIQTADAVQAGNAIVAAKDASGNILWSWHLWFCPNAFNNEQGSLNEETYNTNATMLSFNLGASSVTGAGMYYKWGDKNPSFKLPGAESFTYYGGNIEPCNKEWSATKTMTDPCPPGYKVPANDVWSATKNAATTWGVDYFTYEGSPLVIYPYSSYLDDNGALHKYADTELRPATMSAEKSMYFLKVRLNHRVLQRTKSGALWSSSANQVVMEYIKYDKIVEILKGSQYCTGIDIFGYTSWGEWQDLDPDSDILKQEWVQSLIGSFVDGVTVDSPTYTRESTNYSTSDRLPVRCVKE